MKIINLVVILVCLFINKSYKSQIENIAWSNAIEKEEDIKIYKILTYEDFSVVVFKNQEKKIRLDFFEGNKKVKTKTVTFDGRFIDVVKVGNNVTLFYFKYNSSTKKDELNAKTITKNTETNKKVIEQSYRQDLSVHNNFKIAVSPNYKKVFVLVEQQHKKGNKESVIFCILNNNLDLQRKKQHLITQIISQKRKTNVPIINNEDEVYIIKKQRLQKQSKYFVIGLSKSNSVKIKELNIRNNQIQDIKYTISSEGKLILGGTYRSLNNTKTIGSYITKLDVACNVIYNKKYGFRQDIMLDYTTEKSLKKEGLGLDNLYPKHIINHNDNTVIVLEQKEVLVDKKNNLTTKLNNGLIIRTFNSRGDYVWDKSIKILQKDDVNNGHWNSFACISDTTNEKINIIYNEIGYFNKKYDNNFGINTAIGSRIYEIDNQANGNILTVKNIFENTNNEKYALNLNKTKQVGNKVYIIAENIPNRNKYIYGCFNILD